MVLRARCHSTNAPCFLWWLNFIHNTSVVQFVRSEVARVPRSQHIRAKWSHMTTVTTIHIYVNVYIYVVQFVRCCAVCVEWGGTFTIHSGKLESYDDHDKNQFRLSRILLPVQTKGNRIRWIKNLNSFLSQSSCAVFSIFMRKLAVQCYARTFFFIQLLTWISLVLQVLCRFCAGRWYETPCGVEGLLRDFPSPVD